MIILDTQIWVWWVDNNQRLTQQHLIKYDSCYLDEEALSFVDCKPKLD